MGMCFKSMKSGALKEPKQFGTEGVLGFKSVFVSVCHHAHKLWVPEQGLQEAWG